MILEKLPDGHPVQIGYSNEDETVNHAVVLKGQLNGEYLFARDSNYSNIRVINLKKFREIFETDHALIVRPKKTGNPELPPDCRQ
ncbi:MAG: hypothetical protein HY547_00880 [Elusimicrobia bacterium]|nr:hypothetical protein [Elusimicrobiota bacterium]